MRYDVYISFSWRDRKEVVRICDFLERHGVRCCVMMRDPHPDEEVIAEAVNDSRMVLAVVSSEGKEAARSRAEMTLADQMDKPILWTHLSDWDNVFSMPRLAMITTCRDLCRMRGIPDFTIPMEQAAVCRSRTYLPFSKPPCAGQPSEEEGPGNGAFMGAIGIFGGIMGGLVSKFFRLNSAHAPKEQSDAATEPDSVNACVYAPKEARRNDYMMVQVYLYRDEETDMVKAKAAVVDPSAEIRHYKPLELPLKHGDTLRIQLKMHGISLSQDIKSVRWTGKFNGCEFAVHIPREFTAQTLLGTVEIFVNDMPAGEMTFKTVIVESIASHALTQIYSKRYEKIFVSYSHKDYKTVRSMVEGLRIAKKNYFFDRHTLQGGDRYRDEIRKWIDTCDVFVLCWSKNAAASIEVEKEKKYALEVMERKDTRLKIYPINIEPVAEEPADMKDTYNFAQLNP